MARVPVAARWWGFALAALGLAAWIALVVTYWPFTVDDTFITLRYAENVARGIGPTWNAEGPRAEGYTSPLWMIVLAAATIVGADPELAAKALGVAAMAGAIACTGRLAWILAQRDRELAAGLAVLTIGAAPASAIHAVSGMETALAVLLASGFAIAITRTVHAEDRGRAAIAAVLGLLLSLTRPEANLVVGLAWIAAIALVPRERRANLALAVALGHALPGALYFGWRLHYYGHLLPLPFYVKTVVPDAVLPGAPEAIAFARAQWIERIDVGIALVAAIATLRARATVLAIPALALWLFFFVPAHEMGYDFRYFQPIVPIAVALAAAGAITIAAGASRAAALVPAIAVAGSFLSVVPWIEGSIAEKVGYGAGVARAHARIGHALGAIRDRVDRPVLAALDTGAIAFHSRWHVIDTWGLNDAHVATTGDRGAEYVLSQDPSVVIVVSATADRFVPQFENEQALWDRSRERGLEHVASFEFLPDYQLFVLARPETPEADALVGASD